MQYFSIRDSVLRCTVGPLVVLLFAVLVIYVVLVVLLVDPIDSFRYGQMRYMHRELVHPGTLTQCRGTYVMLHCNITLLGAKAVSPTRGTAPPIVNRTPMPNVDDVRKAADGRKER